MREIRVYSENGPLTRAILPIMMAPIYADCCVKKISMGKWRPLLASPASGLTISYIFLASEGTIVPLRQQDAERPDCITTQSMVTRIVGQ